MKTWTKKFQKMLTLILAICLVTGCMGFSNVQAATGKSGTTYYNTCINGKKGGTHFITIRQRVDILLVS